MCACAGSIHSVKPARTRIVPTSVFRRVFLLCLCALLAPGPSPASSVPVTAFFPFGALSGDNMTERTDDGGSGRINLTVTFPFFGSRHDRIYVNNNGVISFFKELRTYNPENFPLQDMTPIIAPYWADVDISKSNGTVWYRETRNSAILNQATQEIRGYHSAYKNFRAYWIFVATWDDVGFYGAHADGLKKKNTFQAVLVLDSTGQQSFVILNYAKIEWTTGSNSEGDPLTGLGGSPAQAGFNAGDRTNYFEIEGARNESIINLTQTSNVGIAGKWIFRIDSAAIQDSCSISESGQIFFRPSFSSMLGGQLVTIDGPCFSSANTIRGRLEFDDSNLCCYVDDDQNQAKCIFPPVFQTGLVNVSLNIEDRGWNYTGTFEIQNLVDVVPLVTRHDPESWFAGTHVQISWKNTVDFVESASYRFEILVYQLNENNEPSLQPILQDELVYNKNRMYDLEIPYGLSGLGLCVVRVTALVSQCQGFGPSIYSDVFLIKYPSPSESEAVCSDWLALESQQPPLNVIGQCPCTLQQAEGDTAQFSVDPFCFEGSDWVANCQYRSSLAKECIVPNQEEGSSENYVCCYSKGTGELLNAFEGTGGGTKERYTYRDQTETMPPFFTYMEQDLAPKVHCCHLSDNQTLCDQFLTLRQPVSCQGYQTPAAAQAAGDPHIQTLDGLSYTFNGIGEFTLLRVKDTEATVQVKARPALDDDGLAQNATVFTGVALRVSAMSPIVEIRMDNQETQGYSVLIDKEPLDPGITTSKLPAMSIYINGTNNSTSELTVVMDNIGISVLVEVTQDLLNIMVIAGAHLKDQLEGLLGNYNGDESDDLMGSEGTLLSSQAKMRDIHFQFGMTWEVLSNDSLFSSMSVPKFDNTLGILEAMQNEAMTSYSPFFMDELESHNLRNGTLEICGDNMQCVFDYQVTGKETVAVATLKFNQKFAERIMEIQPVVRCPYINALSNGNRTLSGQKVGDDVTFQCLEGFYLTNNTNRLVCQPDGQWSGLPPDCVKVVDTDTFPLLYVAIGTAASGFLLVMVAAFIIRIICKKYSGSKISHKVESSSDFDQPIELPSIFPISVIPTPVFENALFLSSLQKLHEKGAFQIPRPTYVDPNIYSEYF